jgi:hypothetical protein
MVAWPRQIANLVDDQEVQASEVGELARELGECVGIAAVGGLRRFVTHTGGGDIEAQPLAGIHGETAYPLVTASAAASGSGSCVSSRPRVDNIDPESAEMSGVAGGQGPLARQRDAGDLDIADLHRAPRSLSRACDAPGGQRGRLVK